MDKVVYFLVAINVIMYCVAVVWNFNNPSVGDNYG